VGAPVRPNMLNMPKSASDRHSTRCGLPCPGVSRCQRMSFGRLLQEPVCPMLRDCCPVSSVGVLWPNNWMDQDATWYRGRPQPRRHGVRWGPSSPHGRGTAAPPLFSRCLLWRNGCSSQPLLSSCLLLKVML